MVVIVIFLGPRGIESDFGIPCPDGGMLETESDCRHVGPSCRRRDFHSCVGTGIDAVVTGIDAV